MNTRGLKPISLYIHIPWCVKKCPYCDFNSHESAGIIDEKAYLEALLKDLESEPGELTERPVKSIFFGGGTPSLLSSDFYAELLEKLAATTSFAKSLEITLEANPGTADAANFKGYRQAGINRLSLGFQSLRDSSLKSLGRIHDASQAVDAFELARAAGFDNINIDLMFALPGQDAKAALQDLSKVIALNPEHISWYQLTLEPNTLFYAQPPQNLPDNDLAWQMQIEGIDLLTRAGFNRYEVSAYAKTGFECQHNLNYWQYGDYLGIGAGAHGKYWIPGEGFIRTTRKRHPAEYLSGEFLSSQSRLAQADVIAEYFINRLRLFTDFNTNEFSEATGYSPALIEEPLELAIKKNLLVKQHNSYKPTPLGYQFLNDLVCLFL